MPAAVNSGTLMYSLFSTKYIPFHSGRWHFVPDTARQGRTTFSPFFRGPFSPYLRTAKGIYYTHWQRGEGNFFRPMTKAIGRCSASWKKELRCKEICTPRGDIRWLLCQEKMGTATLSAPISSGKERQPVPQEEDKYLLSLYDVAIANTCVAGKRAHVSLHWPSTGYG